MTIIECPRESDVLDAIDAKRWPHRVNQELVDHVAGCEICSDVLTVAYSVAACAALMLTAAAGWFAWPTMHEFVLSLSSAQAPSLASPLTLPLLVAVGALLVIAPVALYLVLSDK